MGPKPKFTGELQNQVVQDYLDGMSLKDMIEKYNCADYSIRKAVKRAGHPLRKIGGKKKSIPEKRFIEIQKMYLEEKLSQDKIAKVIGCGQMQISRILQNLGILQDRRSGKNHGSWKGGITKDSGGYLLEKVSINDPLVLMRGKNGYCRQHRIVMARHLGRPLTENETVHHINGNKEDNRLENLQLRTGKHGKGISMKCACCGSTNIITSELG